MSSNINCNKKKTPGLKLKKLQLIYSAKCRNTTPISRAALKIKEINNKMHLIGSRRAKIHLNGHNGRLRVNKINKANNIKIQRRGRGNSRREKQLNLSITFWRITQKEKAYNLPQEHRASKGAFTAPTRNREAALAPGSPRRS